MNVLKSKNCSIVADNLVSQLMIWHIVSMKKKEDAPVYRRLSRGRKKGENLTLSIKKESTEHFTEIERFGSCEEPNTVATVKEQHANLTPNLTQHSMGRDYFYGACIGWRACDNSLVKLENQYPLHFKSDSPVCWRIIRLRFMLQW